MVFIIRLPRQDLLGRTLAIVSHRMATANHGKKHRCSQVFLRITFDYRPSDLRIFPNPQFFYNMSATGFENIPECQLSSIGHTLANF
jgi:hypothetical protein